jgi:hypothetical protein
LKFNESAYNVYAMTKELREKIINNYIEAYNNFDVDGMLADVDEYITFENISNGEANMTIEGIAAFKEQALQAAMLFKSRQQTITAIEHSTDHIEVNITYHAVLAIDLPNGMKTGDELNLTGKSVFKFNGDKIISIIDIS